jgi:putative ABC transport system permease protein
VFKGAFEPAFGSAIAIAAVLMGLTLLIGFLTGREAFKETPMAALRES